MSILGSIKRRSTVLAVSLRAAAGAAGSARRRGTIIVLALGVLAILAIAALSYVAIVRTDRDSAVSSQRNINVQEQVNTVVSVIGETLAADLFGNKVVTRDVPRRDWPSAFEDGDYTDNPSVFGPWAEDPDLGNNAAIPVIRMNDPSTVAPTDDAFLASTEPVINLVNPANSFWPHITNLRSTYTYTPARDGNPAQWTRGDGLFVDLLQWFQQPTTVGGANAAADLTDGNAYPAQFGTAYHINNAGNLVTSNTRTAVYGMQMNRLEGIFNTFDTTSNAQSRRWADTDGDLRPDARWQQLDALGNAYGLNWVVATRIIDASSLLNYNTASMFPYKEYYDSEAGTGPGGRIWTQVVGTGATPADVDFARLLGYGAATNAALQLNDTFLQELSGVPVGWPVGVRTDRLMPTGGDPAFRRLFAKAMGYGPTMRKLSEAQPAPNLVSFNPPYDKRLSELWYPSQDYPANGENPAPTWGKNDIPTAAQRAAWYEVVGSGPSNLRTDLAAPLPIRDLADLAAFFATNNPSVVSKIEQYADGTDTSGYLPGQSGGNYGPLRSMEAVAGEAPSIALPARRFGSTDETSPDRGLPTLTQIAFDNRHLLTPVSGVGRAGPIPVLNTLTAYPSDQASYFDGASITSRIRLPELESDAAAKVQGGAIAPQQVQRAFDSFTWALAPLATTRALNRSLGLETLYSRTDAANDDMIRHYGGWSGPAGPGTDFGPAALFAKDITGAATTNIRSTFAVLKALCLATNLFDAIDAGTSEPDPSLALSTSAAHADERPTVVRLYNSPIVELPTVAADTANAKRLRNVKVLGTRMPQGNIPGFGGVFNSAANIPLRPEVFGAVTQQANPGSVTAIGLDRQPFLVQAAYYAFYEDSAAIPAGAPTMTIDPADVTDQMGSVLVIELRNPWPQVLDVAEYKVVIRNPANGRQISLDLANYAPGGSTFINPGASTVFIYAMQAATTAPSEVRDFFYNSPTNVIQQIEGMISLSAGFAGNGGIISRLTPGEAGSGGAYGALTRSGTDDLPPVFAQWLTTTPNDDLPVLLVRKAGTLAGTFMTPPGSVEFDVLVDRLSPPKSGGKFPAYLEASYAVTPPQKPNQTPPPIGNVATVGRMRLAITSNVHRPNENSAAAPNPLLAPYVIERRSENTLTNSPAVPDAANLTEGTFQLRQMWVTGANGIGTVVPTPEPSPAEWITTAEGVSVLAGEVPGNSEKGRMNIGSDLIFNFQLFNPTAWWTDSTIPVSPRLRSTADLLLLPTVATVYVHPDPVGVTAADYPRIEDASKLSNSYDGTGAFINFRNTTVPATEGSWVTASEMLGTDWELFGDQRLTSGAAGKTNPWLGVLDPSRSILVDQLTSAAERRAVPDSLTIPFALRVLDCFDALNPPGDLAEGTINLNTAPRRVLQNLPFVSPLRGITASIDEFGATDPGGPVLPDPSPGTPYPLLADWLTPYTDLNLPGNLFGGTTISRTALTGIDFLRTPDGRFPMWGLQSVGELALMSTWESDKLGEIDDAAAFTLQARGFAYLGADSTAGTPKVLKGVPFGRPGQPKQHVTDAMRPVDGPEERLALLRGIANTVSTRSDVFIAWILLRGYDPDVIESINVAAPGITPDDLTASSAMNNAKFGPRVETRWLAVFDRSKIRKPTDRPELLLLVELPSATP